VQQVFDADALIQTYDEYESRGFHWASEVDEE
jgi:hypothetical protein